MGQLANCIDHWLDLASDEMGRSFEFFEPEQGMIRHWLSSLWLGWWR